MRCSLNNQTLLFHKCTDIGVEDIKVLALVRGVVGIFCFLLCLATFLFELFYICCKKNSTTLQRLFVYLTLSNIFYTAALSCHTEHYFTYDEEIQCFVCKVVGFFDQYTGSVQLLLTLGIVFKLFHKVSSFCRPMKMKGLLAHHHFKFEALFVTACFVLPCAVIWVPFMRGGPGGYGLSGPWCWIEVLEEGCSTNSKGFHEQLLLWYVPFAAVSLLSLFCIIAITGFLIYICLHHDKYRSKIRLALMDMLLLLPFLVVFCCACLIEISIVITLRSHTSNLNTYALWMFYAVTTPIGGVVIPIAFFLYFLRKKSFVSSQRLRGISSAHTMQPSSRPSANSYTSQQERPKFLSDSDVEFVTSSDSAVVIHPSLGKSVPPKYGTMNNS